jgi:Arc/MetJ family transcription regulator
MRTNIVLEDELVRKAFKFSTAKSKRELINVALTEFVQNHSRRNISDLRGKIAFHEGYDYKRMRKGELS